MRKDGAVLVQPGRLHSPIGPCGGPRDGNGRHALRDACRSFEACLVQMLLETAGVGKYAGILGSGRRAAPGSICNAGQRGVAQETHGYMWARALAVSIAEGGGLGLAELLTDGLEGGFSAEGEGYGRADSM